MAISVVGGAVGTNTATLPTHQAGDVIVCFAFRDGSTTAPTLPAGWVNIASGGANTCSYRLGYRRATAAGTLPGTWTNASRVSYIILRGAWSNHPHGAIATPSTGTAASVTYPAITPRKTDGSSWIVAFAGHRSVDTTLETAPTGYTAQAAASGVDTIAETACYTLSGPTGTVSSVSRGVGGTASGWAAASLEIMGAPPAGSVENLLPGSSSSGATVSGSPPPGVALSTSGGTLTVTGKGTESGRDYVEYNWTYTNGTGAEDFPGLFFADLVDPTKVAPVWPGIVETFSMGIKSISGTIPANAGLSNPTFTNAGAYVGETDNLNLTTAGVNTSTITNVKISGAAPATSVLAAPQIAQDIAIGGSFNWTFRVYEPQLENDNGTGLRSSTYIPTNGGADYGSSGVSAALAYTEAMDTVAAAATIANRAQLAWTEAADTFAGAASVQNQSQLAWTEAADTLAAAATIENRAQLAYTEPLDTFAGQASLGVMAQFAWAEPPDTFAGQASLAVMASLSWTEAMDALAASGTISNQVQVSYTETMDAVAVSATVANRAQLAWTEPMDALAASAFIENRSSLGYIEALDTFSANALLAVLAGLNYTESVDTFASQATIANRVQLNYTEAMDAFSASATITSGISASLSYTEPMDTVLMTVSLGVVAQLAYAEPMDGFAASVQLAGPPVNVQFVWAERMDLFSGSAWLYPWHETVDPQNNPWMASSPVNATWTDVPGPLSSVWGTDAGLNDETWADRPRPTTVWE